MHGSFGLDTSINQSGRARAGGQAAIQALAVVAACVRYQINRKPVASERGRDS